MAQAIYRKRRRRNDAIAAKHFVDSAARLDYRCAPNRLEFSMIVVTGGAGHGREKGFEALYEFSALRTMVIRHD